MERQSFNGQRFYEADTGFGIEHYPSVTTVLSIISKPFLAQWRGNLGNDAADLYLESQADRGTAIHTGIECLLNGGTILYNPKSKPNYSQMEIDVYKSNNEHLVVLEHSEHISTCLKIKQFLNITKPKIIFTEKTVFSHDLKSAGTLDGLVHIKQGTYKVNGRIPLDLEEGNYLLDLKTGNSISEDHYLQVAAYIKCVLDMKLVDDIKGGLILHTNSANKTGIPGFGVKVRLTREIQEDIEVYKHAYGLWSWKNKENRPQSYTVPAIIQ